MKYLLKIGALTEDLESIFQIGRFIPAPYTQIRTKEDKSTLTNIVLFRLVASEKELLELIKAFQMLSQSRNWTCIFRAHGMSDWQNNSGDDYIAEQDLKNISFWGI